MIKAGDIRQLLINGREMDTAAEGEVEVRLPGYSNETSATAAGRRKQKKTRHLGAMNGLPILVNHDRGDAQFLQGLADGFDNIKAVLVLVDGTTYTGTGGGVNEELTFNTSEAEMEMSIEFENIDKT